MNITDCSQDYIWPTNFVMKTIFVSFNVSYQLSNCTINKPQRDTFYTSFILICGLILLIVLLNAMFLIYYRRLTHEVLETDEKTTKPNKKKKSARIVDVTQSSETPDVALVNQNNTNFDVVQDSDDIESVLKKRLEAMEFYRRLLITQMVKRKKLEESNIEKIGDFLRRGLNKLFGDPHQGLDFTDPQAMFYPYWPDQQDYNLLTAYGAVREHMMNDINNLVPQSSMNSIEQSPYLMNFQEQNQDFMQNMFQQKRLNQSSV